MKKQLFIFAFAVCGLNVFSQTTFTVENFEAKALNEDLPMREWNAGDGTAIVKANPTDAAQKSALIVTSNYDAHLKINVTLPVGKNLTDYNKIKFDIYLNQEHPLDDYKKMMVYAGNDVIYQDADYTIQAPIATWTTKEYTLSNLKAINTFDLDLGITTDKGNYYIDNIVLVQKSATALSEVEAETFSATVSSNTIELSQVASSLMVFDITGQMLVSAENTSSVEVSLRDGSVYVIKAVVNGRLQTVKIVK
ncbi:hypothetical protein LX69_03007 [Breznakibacter xylanolyticus]|uniref:Uncharacterized protein n=1 Tax=Breznakibacter xylanolyticus TaxID=990 RepID=A0A2W7MW34_9BACT|nr:hypothetical protein [Breznakibacter xylanolyticus]PZX11861.1 hypothetical protein LX69_03007 [Breznakibacter xylanolyticus]